MRITTKGTKSMLLYGTLLLLLMQIPLFVLFDKGREGQILYLFLVVLVILTIWKGAITGLISSLILIFVSGSILLYMSIAGTISTINDAFSIQLFLVYGVLLLVLILCAGKVNELLLLQEQRISHLQQSVNRFVAIDVETGFDNETRMYLTVNEEMRRANRYKHQFIFILLRLENYKQFEQLYGVNEVQHLWKQLAEKVQQTVRQTDKKFRFGDNQIALLLTDTSDEFIDVVYEKLDYVLKNHQLLNGRWVTLSYKTSYFLYTSQVERSFEELLTDLEREMRTNEL
ncbi:diguanylate cyclase domain-containing protein [Metasolibacillus meyeri]|uniref:diguanylate cyclase domain-containing protein n=1 Tax=Metasolibacillus meyeri TaxID=1071052 RepID=UPI000D3172ED|nr:diguanylate cyclase [Metasolibacillus meyeri]